MKSVEITISDPWEFFDENDGNTAFQGDVVSVTAGGHWVVRLRKPAKMSGQEWHFAIPTTRAVGQKYFDDPNEVLRMANILFITDEQANSIEWLSTFNSQAAPNTPWGIGTCEPSEHL
jgi:hypothetical protein